MQGFDRKKNAYYSSLQPWLGIWGVFLARIADEFAKVSVFEWRRRRVNWGALAAGQRGQEVAAH